MVLISAAPAVLGGTSGLAWGAEQLWDESTPPGAEGPWVIARSWGWIIAAAVVALPFIGILGPGIRF